MTVALALAGFPRRTDPESWSEAFTVSAVVHVGLGLLVTFLGTRAPQAPRIALTEVRFVERAVETPAPPAPVSVPQGAGRAPGQGALGSPGRVTQASSHPQMGNVVPLSSPQGTADGDVVTAAPMAGPIVPLGDIGVVGRKKGALAPLAGRTEGGRASGYKPMPTTGVTGSAGSASLGTGYPIALSTEEISSIRKREASLGVPLIGAPVVADSVKKSIPKGSVLAGSARSLSKERLMANPLEKQDWGKKKGPFSMEGPLKYRKILSMELPPYPRWAEEKAIEATVSFRLWVDPKGKVKENFYLEKTSGYAELDSLARASLQKFKFVALPSEQPQEDEWGVATFRFQLRK